jgi:peptide/nickel transport system ATP-binding protein
MDKLLQVQNLGVSFLTPNGSKQVVQNVSFDLLPAQTLGIVGESGSGKSISSRALLGLLPKKQVEVSGEALFSTHSGETVSLLRATEKQMEGIRGKQISMIFQEPMTALNPVKTCGDQVAEMLRYHERMSQPEAREKVLDLFEEVLLPRPRQMLSAYPFSLSGGQRQRVLIAMAIACHPRLLIADEPTTALDVSVQRAILDLLNRLRDKYSLGLIFISHDLLLIREISDEVLVMHQGKVIEQGRTTDIFLRPQSGYTKGLMACKPGFGPRPARLPVVEDFLNDIHPDLPENEDLISRQKRHQETYKKDPIIEVSNLEVSYRMKGRNSKDLLAVNQVSFSIYQGETLGLVGESGSGKTTLGRSLVRLIHSSSGNILFDGKEISQIPKREMKAFRRRIQIVFQDPFSSLNPRMRIGEAIMEPMRVHGIVGNRNSGMARVQELFRKVQLPVEFFHRYPHELSGGQRQRVGIARALSLEPELLVCDESVSALDVSVQAHILNLLNDLKNEYGLTYLFISHDLTVVRHMSDRVMVMHQGRLVELAETDQLFSQPEAEYTLHLLAAQPGK